MSKKVAIVGTGLIGRSWSIVFARAGLEVWLWDPVEGAVSTAIKLIKEGLPSLAEENLLTGCSVEQVFGRVHASESLEDALDGAYHLQESAPEQVEVKQELYSQIDRLVDPQTVLASSTSGIVASLFTENLSSRERCLVAHPINPPHLVPLVELVPTPWTAENVLEKTSTLMQQVNQAPILLNREIKGFVANRLQGALLAEAFRLVEDGICSVKDIDTSIAEGLGLRWSFMGPFETIDLNSPTGIRGYCKNFGSLYFELAQEQADPRFWGEALLAKVEQERREDLSADKLLDRQHWRNQRLALLMSAKKEGEEKLGK
ncbi:MAG: 3-hydroxyacyl-CoA dehydrogenase [Deltaproteobacteria bacterium]|jgi:3-hydroxyacyl-CoA dehydrogenase|nr:3-hydroxyacyl-CoA dehydrogenase [Deltaproteobacteria bacterium]